MPNLRIVSDNAIARAASLVASSTAGSLVAANLAIDRKSSVHRATSTSVIYTAAWDAAERIGCVALPFCNLSPTAQWRIRAHAEGSTVNYARYSESFASTAWTREYCSVGTTEAASAGVKTPAGTSPAKFKETSGTAEHYLRQDWSVPAGQQVTFAVMVKAAERGFVCLKFDSGANTAIPIGSAAIVNLATGAVTPNILNTEAGWQFGAVALGGGWWRFYATCTTTASGNVAVRVGGAINATDMSYSGVANSGFYIWGAQFEYGPMSSYYPNNTNGPVTRPIGYTDNWQTSADNYDSGWVSACPAPAARPRGFTAAQAASAYAHGGGACARHWLPIEVQPRLLIVEINDPSNLQGYIEAACMVAGPVWSPKYNASGTSVSIVDRTQMSRSAAGDPLPDPGTISRKVPVDLRKMSPADRAKFLDVVRNSRAYPILLSVFPEHVDLALERDHMLYGHRTKDSDVAYQFSAVYSTTIEIEEI